MGKKKRITRKTRRKTKLKILRRAFISFLIILMVMGAGILYLFHDLPDISNLTSTRKPSISIRDANGIILASYGDLYGSQLIYSDIPSYLIDALIATEDRRFFEHSGIDLWGIIRAAYQNSKAGKIVQGGSTITQQLAKITFLSPQKNLKRKLQEVIIAKQLEEKFSKEQILTMYLNKVYLGKGTFGIDAASRYYFGKPAQSLELYESAMLVGLLKAPSKYSPVNNFKLSTQRAKQVLLGMVEAGFLERATYDKLTPPKVKKRGRARGVLQNPYFSDYVLEQLPTIIGNVEEDINIYTTLDLEMQKRLEDSVLSAAKVARKRYNVRQAAALVLNKNGEIKAMVGGLDYGNSQFNRVTLARRQPGSISKLYVYLAALEKGYKLGDIVDDSKVEVKGWNPKNYSGKYVGKVKFETAFAKSINTVAVSLAYDVGIGRVAEITSRLSGYDKWPTIPSLALGSVEMTMMEVTRSYLAIQNDGYARNPHGIKKITDTKGNVLYLYNDDKPEKVLSGEVSQAMKELLRLNVECGTGKRAKLRGITAYGKTGTSQKHRDAWFVGFQNDLIATIWMGNDDDKPMRNMTGGRVPAEIWRDFMSKSLSIRYLPRSEPAEVQTIKQENFDTIESIIEKHKRLYK